MPTITLAPKEKMIQRELARIRALDNEIRLIRDSNPKKDVSADSSVIVWALYAYRKQKEDSARIMREWDRRRADSFRQIRAAGIAGN